MGEKDLVSAAQRIKTGFSLFCTCEAVLGALAVAGEEPLALAAGGRQGVALVYAEADLGVGSHHLPYGSLGYVAKAVFGIDEMVAGVKVAVMLQDGITAAGFRKDTYPGRNSAPAG